MTLHCFRTLNLHCLSNFLRCEKSWSRPVSSRFASASHCYLNCLMFRGIWTSVIRHAMHTLGANVSSTNDSGTKSARQWAATEEILRGGTQLRLVFLSIKLGVSSVLSEMCLFSGLSTFIARVMRSWYYLKPLFQLWHFIKIGVTHAIITLFPLSHHLCTIFQGFF